MHSLRLEREPTRVESGRAFLQVLHPVEREYLAGHDLHGSEDLLACRLSLLVRDAEQVQTECLDVRVFQLLLGQVVHRLVECLALELQRVGQFALLLVLEDARDVHAVHILLQLLDEVGGVRVRAVELLELHVTELVLESLDDGNVLLVVFDDVQDIVAAAVILVLLLVG